MAYQIQAEDGSLLDAHFDLDGDTIVFHSRGGSKVKNGTNLDYTPALTLLIERLAAAARPVQRAWLDSAAVQDKPVADRIILDGTDISHPAAKQVSLMATRMQAMGRKPTAKSPHGNYTKRIRLQISPGTAASALVSLLKAVPSKKDFRSQERLPVSELEKVTAEHLWDAVQRLLAGPVEHDFDDSDDYDVLLEDGTRLPPKVVFGLALSAALGIVAKPKHFSGGQRTPCFRSLEAAGYRIVPKETGSPPPPDLEPEKTDQEWLEGTPKFRGHLRRERYAGLREAKKAEFRRTHGGKLFCERCGEDPVAKYMTEHADSCIEVHHSKVQVANMEDGHKTRLEDLQCLCANCHRLEHRLLRVAIPTPTATDDAELGT